MKKSQHTLSKCNTQFYNNKNVFDVIDSQRISKFHHCENRTTKIAVTHAALEPKSVSPVYHTGFVSVKTYIITSKRDYSLKEVRLVEKIYDATTTELGAMTLRQVQTLTVPEYHVVIRSRLIMAHFLGVHDPNNP